MNRFWTLATAAIEAVAHQYLYEAVRQEGAGPGPPVYPNGWANEPDAPSIVFSASHNPHDGD